MHVASLSVSAPLTTRIKLVMCSTLFSTIRRWGLDLNSFIQKGTKQGKMNKNSDLSSGEMDNPVLLFTFPYFNVNSILQKMGRIVALH